ncbi:MAG: hypothetical protein KJO98_13795, partial [Rhodothermia bacterium]|nr:hypothetical protein [Rhodothermia bacterium]
KLPVKKLESASEQTTPDGDCVPTVPVVAKDSAFVDSCDYIVQLETEFPYDSASNEGGASVHSAMKNSEPPVRRAA